MILEILKGFRRVSKSLETLGWGRRPGGVLGIYIHVYTFWRETACLPDSAAALETALQRSPKIYLHFAAALKTLRVSMRTKRVKGRGGLYRCATGGGYN